MYGTSRICVFATDFCNCNRCNLRKCKRRINEKNLHVDDLVLMSKNTANLKEKVSKWKEAFESKRLKVNLKKNGSKGEVLKSNVDPCVKCGNRVVANSVKCTSRF